MNKKTKAVAKADAVVIPLRRKGMSDREYEKRLKEMATKAAAIFQSLVEEGFSTQMQELPGRCLLIRGLRIDEMPADQIASFGTTDGIAAPGSLEVQGLPDIIKIINGLAGGGRPLVPRFDGGGIPGFKMEHVDELLASITEQSNGIHPADKEGSAKVAEGAVKKFARSKTAQDMQVILQFLEKERAIHSPQCASPACPFTYLVPALIEALQKESAANVH